METKNAIIESATITSDDGADVAEVAKQYGGGGHRNAAGFRVSFAQAQAFEV